MALTSGEFKNGYAVFRPIADSEGRSSKEVVTRVPTKEDADEYIKRQKTGREEG